MAIRRFRDHVVEHDWFAVAVDIGVVVIGVFLGIQVSNWNSDRLDRAKGHEYRLRLAEELKDTQTVFGSFGDYVGTTRSHGLAALDAVNHPDRPAGVDFLVDAYQASQTIPRTGRHTTFDEIVSAGDLALIGPPQLRDRVSNYFWRMDGLSSLDSGATTYRELLRAAMPIEVQEAIRTKCDDIPVDVGKGLIAPRLPTQCRPEIAPESAAAAAARLRQYPGLKDALTRQLSVLDSRSTTYSRLVANAAQVRSVIVDYDQTGRTP